MADQTEKKPGIVDAQFEARTLPGGKQVFVVKENFDDGSEREYEYEARDANEARAAHDHFDALLSGRSLEDDDAEELTPLDSEEIPYQEYKRRRGAGE